MALEAIKDMPLAEKLAIIDRIAGEINDKAGKKVVGRIGADPAIMDKLRIKFIPSKSPDMNRATGGGYPRSRCTIVAGAPDSGKTSRVLEDIGYNMQNDPNFVACWVESEKSLEKSFVCDTFHIDPQRFVFIEYDAEKGAEGVLDMLYGFMFAVKFDLVCINSLKCLTPKKILEGDMDQCTPAIAARLNSVMTAKFTALVANNETAFILITHQYTGIGAYGSPMVISGGNAIQYWSALTMTFTRPSLQDGDPVGKDEGAHFKVSIKKNHCMPNKNPYVKFDYFIVFGDGTEMILSLVDKMVENNILSVNHGSYTVFDEEGNELQKIRGKNNYRNFMKENPELFNKLVSRLDGKDSTIKNMTVEEIEQAKQEEAELEKDAKALGLDNIDVTPNTESKKVKKSKGKASA